MNQTGEPRLIIHGGAWNIPQKFESAHLEGINHALIHVNRMLNDGCSAVDAVEKAVNILEENPTYDAGRGAFLNARGEVELDAIIVEGRSIQFGAVAGVQNILHPVSLARKVMEETEHCLLIGDGAKEFAMTLGIPILDPQELLTPREINFYKKIHDDPTFKTHIPFDQYPSDTVGAVALDVFGNLAAATSTGGTPRKMQGRVGDSPILGAGAYADNDIGACSTTGWGESIMRAVLAKRILDGIQVHGITAGVQSSFHFLTHRIGGLAGSIGITNQGKYFHHYNTPKMAFGYVSRENKTHLHIKSND
jgi:beta-aspartyl-peptidase (threonine type)